VGGMSAPIRLGFVVNFVPSDPPGPWLGAYLPKGQYSTEILTALPRPGSFWAWRDWLPPYISEFVHLGRRRYQLDAFDVLFTWELRNTLATIVLRRMTGQHSARLISLNPALKGWSLRALPLLRPLLRDADCFVLFSRDEQETQRRQMRLGHERFVFVPRFAEAKADTVSRRDGDCSTDRFVLALGHSNRDFPTLWDALRGTELRTVMYRNAWMRGRELPNITAITPILPAADEDRLVSSATLLVIPLKPASFSAGLTVLLRAMAHGKAVVVSDTTGIRDYVSDGLTGVLVPPGDPDAMLRLWRDPAERERLGLNAAEAVRERFAADRVALELADMARRVLRSNVRGEEAKCASW
jgi:hypothetical protein